MATISTDTPAKPLRQRMQHDMMMQGLLPRTQEQYIRHVRRFAAYLGRPPDMATAEDLRNFQIHQHESGASAGTVNGAVSALRFLYTVTLHQPNEHGIIETWQDDEEGKLESKLAEVAATLIVTGEREFRERLRKDEERAEQERIEREAREEHARIEYERRRVEKLAELNQQRIDAVLESGRLMREAAELRALIPQVREALAFRSDIDAETIDSWEAWALAEADKIDPIVSGQVLMHVRAPALERE